MPSVILNDSEQLNIENGASILEVALKAGVNIPYSCNDGRCGTCKAKVVKGNSIAAGSEDGLSEREKMEDWILTCVRTPLEDLQLIVDLIADWVFPEVKLYPSKIKSIEFFAEDILKVHLQLPPKISFSFVAGQYIDLIAPAGFRRSYSIAGMNKHLNLLELHIRTVKGGMMSDYLVNQAKPNDLLRFQGPKGTFCIKKDYSGKDIYLLATGTGIAPFKVMLEQFFSSESESPNSITLIWGCRNSQDFYIDFRYPTPNFTFVPVLSRPNQDWKGELGYVQNVLMGMKPDLTNSLVFACGSNRMIKSSKDFLINEGLSEKSFISEAFISSS
jgi:CDP-4-dehydro-6-deoxyglucose reductase